MLPVARCTRIRTLICASCVQENRMYRCYHTAPLVSKTFRPRTSFSNSSSPVARRISRSQLHLRSSFLSWAKYNFRTDHPELPELLSHGSAPSRILGFGPCRHSTVLDLQTRRRDDGWNQAQRDCSWHRKVESSSEYLRCGQSLRTAMPSAFFLPRGWKGLRVTDWHAAGTGTSRFTTLPMGNDGIRKIH